MDKKQEKLTDSLIEQRKSLWTALLLLNGGLVGLALSFSTSTPVAFNLLKIIFLFIGLFLDHVFLVASFDINKRLNELFK
ncbi:MAG: hypothetical protein WC197_02100 [Candidatus Gastranaerophilaceae bacterium]